MLHEIFTKEELDQMERCKNRIALTILMATTVVLNLPEYLEKKCPTSTTPLAVESSR